MYSSAESAAVCCQNSRRCKVHFEPRIKHRWWVIPSLLLRISYLSHCLSVYCVICLLTLNMLNCFKDYKRCIHISYHLEFCSTEDQIHNGTTLHVAYPILSIPCLLMPWWLKEPGHQQAWYWPSKLEYSISSIKRAKTLKWLPFCSHFRLYLLQWKCLNFN